MKVAHAIAAAALVASLALAGCNVNQQINTGTTAVNNVCAAGAPASADIATIVSQVAAANKSNAQVQAVLAKVNAGTTLAQTDCQLVQALAALANIAVQVNAVK